MEVPIVGSDEVKWAHVKVPTQRPPSQPCCPSSSDMAGTVVFSSSRRCPTVWRVHKSIPTTLELLELDDNEAHLSGVQLAFDEPLSPYIAVYSDQVQMSHEEGTLSVCVVTISAVVYILKLRTLFKYKNVSAIAGRDMFQFSLVGELARLDQITSFAGLGGSICVGGKSGSILCYPFQKINAEAKDQCFELKDSDAILGRLWGLVARVKGAGPLQSLNMQLHIERELLFALHEDGTFRLWDLHDRSRLLSFNLYKGDLTGFIPKRMWVEEQDVRLGSRQIAFLFQKEGATREDALSIYDLQFGPSDGASGQQATLVFQAHLSGIQGTILDLKLLSDNFWKLEEVNGQFNLKHYGIKRREMLECCKLLEAELENQLFQKQSDDWEDLILFQQSINTSSKVELRFPVSELLLSRILQPGVYQQHPLRKALEKFKRKVSEADFLTITREGVRKEILAVTEAESISDGKMNCLMKWKAFCREYVTSWKDYNTPYAVIVESETGNVGLIRRQSLSIKRSVTRFEKVHRGIASSEVTNSLSEAEAGSEGDFMDAIHKCTSTIVRQLGRLPVSAFAQILLGNKHASISHLSSVFLHLLDVGYDYSSFTTGTTQVGVDVGRRKTLDYSMRHRKLELELILDLHHLRDSAGSWARALDNIEKYVNQLMQDTQFFISKTSEGLEHGLTSKRLVLKSTAQFSWTHFEAARDLLLLLCYLVKIKGQLGINNSEISKIQLDLIVQLKKILWLSLLVYWLTISFAELAPPEDFSLHLSTLRLDSMAASKHNDQHVGARDMTLAEILLPACSETISKGHFLRSKGILGSDNLLLATKAFTSFLMWGENSDCIESLSSRSVFLGATLLRHGQYTALQDFLRIVDDICNDLEVHDFICSRGDWCARLHLMGCGLLGQTQDSFKVSSVQNRVEKAIHCFFRVASVMGQDKADLQALIYKTGMETSFPVHGAISSWKFHYYEWVMQIFEHNNEIEGACKFAHTALQEVDNTAKSEVMGEMLELSNALSIIKGRLWANIFKFSLDRKKFKEAYCAIISNPDRESKYICLRRFLIVLCEQKATEVLCGSELPYVGMLERVEQELLLKAHHSDIMANPNPFKLLYSFHMKRNNWRRAAFYMYLFYIRMKEASLADAGLPAAYILQEQLNSLSAAINALQLVDPVYAWLDLESDMFGSLNCRPSSKRMRVYANNDAGYSGQISKRSHVDLGEIEKDYTLTLAQLLLVEAHVQLNLHGGDLSPGNVLVMLVQSGLYEMAFTLLFQFWKDSSLKSELERIFQIMAEKWCMHQQDKIIERPLSRSLIQPERNLLLLPMSELEIAVETEKSSTNSATKDMMSNASCNSLQVCLEKYVKLHPQIPVVVAETMLSVDRLIELPFWLVEILKGGRQAGSEGMSPAGANPSALLRIYLDFDRIREAALLFLDFVKSWLNLSPADVIKRKKMFGVWFPYTLVDRLKVRLSELNKSEQFESLEHLLDNTLSRYFNQAEVDSNDVKSLVEN